MNAVEIEEAISVLAGHAFNSIEFPFAFLQAFGNKETTIKRLRSGASNKSDLGGVLQTNNIHIAVSPPGEVAIVGGQTAYGRTLKALNGEFDARLRVIYSNGTESNLLRGHCKGLFTRMRPEG